MSPAGPSPAPLPAPSRTAADRTAALFLAAAVAFNPPLLRVFGAGDTVAGLPLLFVYVFAVWAAAIVAAALNLERGGGR